VCWRPRRGAYPELRGYRIGPGAIADGVVGAAIALLWLTPYVVFPALPRGEPFDRSILGEGREGLTLALRLAGFGLVTPFMEELFVRSFLLRFAEVITEGDFRALPIARFATRGFVVTVLWFTFSHQTWEWLVALPTGIALNAWLYARRHLGACVVAHAVANASIWAVVVFGERALWEFL
jgi:CAAX prenyl protease-like protein